MAHSSSPEASSSFTPSERTLLLDTAADSINYGVHRSEPFPVVTARFPEPLQMVRGSFVTLKKEGELRGCIGTIEALQPLIVDVAENAYRAAFRDPRFPQVQLDEVECLRISISILTAPACFPVDSEADLLRQLRPGVDGLILEEGSKRATFLPTVWESLPSPRDFVLHLKRKAGWADNHWSPQMACYRYTTETVG
jgi:AmmeMemoRadiSam system protein A